MIKVNEKSMGAYHTLVAQKNVNEWKKGEMKKDCWIQLMSCGRVAVMGNIKFKPDPKGSPYPIAEYDFFYKVFASIQAVHDAFTEQLPLSLK